jgi:hypothetical protein
MIEQITQAVYDHIIAAVGPDVDNRVRPIHLPPGHPDEEVVPAVVYRLMHAGQQVNLSGRGAVYQVRFQIDVTDRSFANTIALADKLIARFRLQTDPPIIWSEVDYSTFFEHTSLQMYRFVFGLALYTDIP